MFLKKSVRDIVFHLTYLGQFSNWKTDLFGIEAAKIFPKFPVGTVKLTFLRCGWLVFTNCAYGVYVIDNPEGANDQCSELADEIASCWLLVFHGAPHRELCFDIGLGIVKFPSIAMTWVLSPV